MNFNRVYLIGRITKVEYAYYFKGEYFIRACMLVERTSGNSDLIPVVIPMSFITEEDIGSNKKLSLCGEIRKYYGKIYVFAIKAKFISSTFEDRNEVELTAFISDISEIRVTPVSRKTIISFSVVCHDNQKRYCRIPCIAWGEDAHYIEKHASLNDCIFLIGRFQSRKYLKKYEDTEQEKTTYEISCYRTQLI